jgi:nitrogen fixation protein FixH
LLFVLIGSTVVVNVVMLVVAVSDPSFKVHDDKGGDDAWTARMDQQRENRRLGWTLTPRVVPPPENGAYTVIELSVTDPEGAAVTGAEVRASAYHKARPAERQTIQLAETDAGRYVVSAELQRIGIWALETLVERGGDRFATLLEIDTSPSREGRPRP